LDSIIEVSFINPEDQKKRPKYLKEKKEEEAEDQYHSVSQSPVTKVKKEVKASHESTHCGFKIIFDSS
jgi:hypothetical protein